jgi:single-strand DNA-binding protein
MNGTEITIVGNVGNDPELRFTPGGAAVATFSVAVAERKMNPETGKFEDDGATWWRVSAWRSLAEGLAESVSKGTRVMVHGTVRSREWTDPKTGEKRTSWEIQAIHAGPELTWATAKVSRNEKSGRGPAPTDPRGTGAAVHRSRPTSPAPAGSDPWAGNGPAQEPPTGWGAGHSDEPPF